ncbi:hypothetical protein C8F04DRAFT_1062877 [Mycena alexandri]|uniref:F-box domain-containing protein n=1 Tax=Mycena alexandri TaxID=1745969 RepID=A0AAD6TIC7_9AGAR|nr:hypothetical protein C8F04DRAFT_1062877 [Mycena alexandri]
MVPDFPIELIEFFLNYLVDWEAKRSLARCALVCKAWHYPSTSRSFATVLLDNDDIEALFELAKTSLVPLPDFIRRLRFYEDSGHPLPPNHITAVRGMHRVQELCLTLSDNSIHRYQKILSTTFTSLHTLKFYFRYNNSMDTILPLLSSLHSIQNLEILYARHNFFSTYTFPPDYHFPPNLTSIAIQTKDINGLFEQILSLRPLPLFSSIVWLGFVGWDDLDSPISRYLRQAGAALHHLHIAPGKSLHFHSFNDASLLSHSVGLRSLHISSAKGIPPQHASHAPRDILLGVLPHLHAPQLASISIEADGVNNHDTPISGLAVDARDRTWTAIDTALTEDKFAKLQTLAIGGVSQPWIRTQMIKNMPFCIARGILVLE